MRTAGGSKLGVLAMWNQGSVICSEGSTIKRWWWWREVERARVRVVAKKRERDTHRDRKRNGDTVGTGNDPFLLPSITSW